MSAGSETPGLSDNQNPTKKRKIEEGQSSQQSQYSFEQLRDGLLTSSLTNVQFGILAKLCETRANVHQLSLLSVKASEILKELKEEDLSAEEKRQAEKELQQVIDDIKILEAKHDIDIRKYYQKATITLTFQYQKKHLVTVEAICDGHELTKDRYELIVDGETRSELSIQALRDLLQISPTVPEKAFRALIIHLCNDLDEIGAFYFEKAWK